MGVYYGRGAVSATLSKFGSISGTRHAAGSGQLDNVGASLYTIRPAGRTLRVFVTNL